MNCDVLEAIIYISSKRLEFILPLHINALLNFPSSERSLCVVILVAFKNTLILVQFTNMAAVKSPMVDQDGTFGRLHRGTFTIYIVCL